MANDNGGPGSNSSVTTSNTTNTVVPNSTTSQQQQPRWQDSNGPMLVERSQLQQQDQQQQQQQYPRPKQKYSVGAGTGARLNTRASTSSKSLHKLAAQTTVASTKPRARSPSPPIPTAAAITSSPPAIRNSSSTQLPPRQQHASQVNLRRNKIADVPKKSRSSTRLKRNPPSSTTVQRAKPPKGRVVFTLASDEADDDGADDDQGDEWVDASNNTTPLISRRGSIAESDQPPANPSTAMLHPNSQRNASQHSPLPPEKRRPGSHSPTPDPDATTGQAKGPHLPRLLQRSSSHGLPPVMSNETASVRLPPSSHQQSADSDHLSGGGGGCAPTSPAQTLPNSIPVGSSGRDAITSRFVLLGSHDSTPGRASFFPIGSGPWPQYSPEGHDVVNPDDGRLAGSGSGLAASVRNSPWAASSRTGATVAPPPVNRTQQKLYLDRASSNLEPPGPHPGMGMGHAGLVLAAGPLVGGSGLEDRDPRVGRIIERSKAEYAMVRRYHNPILDSFTRLAPSLTEQDAPTKSRRISRPGTSASMTTDHSRWCSQDFTTSSLPQTDTDMHAVRHSSGSSVGHSRPLPDATATLRALWNQTMDLDGTTRNDRNYRNDE